MGRHRNGRRAAWPPPPGSRERRIRTTCSPRTSLSARSCPGSPACERMFRRSSTRALTAVQSRSRTSLMREAQVWDFLEGPSVAYGRAAVRRPGLTGSGSNPLITSVREWAPLPSAVVRERRRDHPAADPEHADVPASTRLDYSGSGAHVRFLVTGHTGFKGSWLTLMLAEAGHEVSGLALDPAPGSLFESRWPVGAACRGRCSLRRPGRRCHRRASRDIAPDVVIHMAAQPLVRASYTQPRWTFETNVMGTLVRSRGHRGDRLRAGAVMVTTDKVYRNVGQLQGYRETDRPGRPRSLQRIEGDGGHPRVLVGRLLREQSRRDRTRGQRDRRRGRSRPTGCSPTSSAASRCRGAGGHPQPRGSAPLAARARLPERLSPARPCPARTAQAAGAWNFGPEPASFRTVR